MLDSQGTGSPLASVFALIRAAITSAICTYTGRLDQFGTGVAVAPSTEPGPCLVHAEPTHGDGHDVADDAVAVPETTVLVLPHAAKFHILDPSAGIDRKEADRRRHLKIGSSSLA